MKRYISIIALAAVVLVGALGIFAPAFAEDAAAPRDVTSALNINSITGTDERWLAPSAFAGYGVDNMQMVGRMPDRLITFSIEPPETSDALEIPTRQYKTIIVAPGYACKQEQSGGWTCERIVVGGAGASAALTSALVDAAPAVVQAPTSDPLAELAALKAAYASLQANSDPSVTVLLWAGVLAAGLKVGLSVFMQLVYKETKSWTRWVALGAAVPIALLSHFALDNGWFASLVYASAGPGAIIVHELLAAIAKPKATGTLAALLVGTLTLGACKLPGPVPVVADATIDCLGSERPKIEALLVELTPLVFLQAPDWSAVYQRAKQAGKDVGGCVLAELVQRYLAPAPGDGRTAPSVEASWPAHDALERFRRDEAGGATFHTAYGEL